MSRQRVVRMFTERDETEDKNNGTNGAENNDFHNEIFETWSEQQFKDTLKAEPWISRLYRSLAIMAGLIQPLGERDYKLGVSNKEYGGNEDEFDAFYLQNKVENVLSGYQLHTDQLPFDAYRLFKEAKLWFLFSLVLLYFLCLSILFAVFGWVAGCFDNTVFNMVNAIAHGFLLLSGVGDQILVVEEQSVSACLWINSMAILIGVYVSLPIFGGAVLVRLLEHRSDLIRSSNTILLTRIHGRPMIMTRCVSGNGVALSNFDAHLEVYIVDYDNDLNETFVINETLPLGSYPKMLGFHPNLLKHVCDETSPLIQRGAVVVDEHGIPQLNRAKIIGFLLLCNADDTKCHTKQYLPHPRLLIEPDEKGRLPFFGNSTPVNVLQWKQYKGKFSGVHDLSKLSSWRYNPTAFRSISKKE